jgi:hypothetical protein
MKTRKANELYKHGVALEITSKEDVPARSRFEMIHTTAASTPINKDLTYKVLKIKEMKGKELHNTTFVVYDLETMPHKDTGLITPYLLGWTIIKNTSKGISMVRNTYLLPFRSNKEDIVQALLAIITDIDSKVINATQKKVYLYAHNGGKFDIKILLNSLLFISTNTPGYKLPNIIADREHDIYQLELRRNTGLKDNKKRDILHTYIFRDSYKVLSAPVAALGKTYLEGKITKIEIPIQILNLLLTTQPESIQS